MDKLKTLLSRVRWAPVIGLLLLMIIFIVILVRIPLSKYNTQGSIALDATASPGKIKLGERSTIEIEIKNRDKYEKATVTVEVRTFDENFLFVESADMYGVKEDILIGPQEIRKLEFRVRALPGALPGKYGIEVKAKEKNYAESAEDKVYVQVSKG